MPMRFSYDERGEKPSGGRPWQNERRRSQPCPFRADREAPWAQVPSLPVAAEQTQVARPSIPKWGLRVLQKGSQGLNYIMPINRPAYRAIVNLGWDVVPFLLKDIQSKRGFWFPALAEITGIRPFDKSDAGNPRRMAQAWIAWGQKKGLV